ncbi:transmembrane protein 51 [Thamnophis elegans]|uniref:transmembrane protein 51 n=1 Tax=Thamnophis elegans TaxID=35005 RepID=UPI001376CA82|nr:transmembrane protein 51 [Thamnophis elegans]XP_032087908.1 transmembrane protein 51 [Thamnophis elegans]XP_032087909.1 transmembrane protein 51 [Thamnophis elegans]XP_032087910.1 transmembrane protein 51 [Thamnophis elegans]XP_032087911.1 transmembrane protein 51 [Thamnophis elegans]XP_032087912.1 transmembrane protein 51 [Thamnophis elegans]XP_032087913.1 transmembrane protein 51 [Thamnophis elegans]
MAQSRSSSGSHYALTAIGLGMLVLGVIMAVWNLVPGFGLSAKPHPAGGHHNETEVSKGPLHRNKTFSVAYVLVGAGVLLLLFSICLTIRDRRKPRHHEDDDVRIRPQPSVERPPPEDSQEEDNESLSRYYVPSYEEVVNGLYPQQPRLEAEGGARISISLPSYESLTGLDESLPTRPSPTAAGTATGEAPGGQRPPARQSSRLSKRLKPLKVRRIKSEKLHLKSLQLGGGTPPARVTIEPLTPPPQYDEAPPKLPDPQEGEP